jgi:hypothetical protein
MGILPNRNPDTSEGLESQLCVEIRRILAGLQHLTELEFEKPHRTLMDSGKAATLELLRGLPTSWEVLRSSEPCLSLSTLQRMNLGAL